MSEFDDMILFDEYLMNEMKPESRASFEQRLADDADFKERFENFKADVEEIRSTANTAEPDDGLDIFRERYHETREKYKDQPGFRDVDIEEKAKHINRSRRFRIFFSAMSLAAMLLLFLFSGNFFQPQLTTDELIVKYYELPEDNLTKVFKGTTPERTLNELMKLYNDRNFERFIEETSQNPTTDSIIKMHLYRGVALYELSNYQECVNELSKIESSSFYHKDALWFSAIAHIKAGNNKAAAEKLDQLIKQETNYEKQSKKLRKSIEPL